MRERERQPEDKKNPTMFYKLVIVEVNTLTMLWQNGNTYEVLSLPLPFLAEQ